MLYLELLILLSFSVPASVFDCKKLKIPNFIAFPFMGVGLIWGILTRTSSIWQDSIAFVLIFILGYFRIMGLGDIKMLMGISLLSGWQIAGLSFVFACIIFVIYNWIFKFKDFFSSSGSKQKQPFYIHILIGTLLSYLVLHIFLLKEVFI